MLKFATKFAPCPTALERAYRAGFRHAELYLDVEILADWQTVLRYTRHFPNTYAMHFPNRRDLSRQSLEDAVALYQQLGCQCLVIHQPEIDKYQHDLLAREPKIRLAVENHRLDPAGFKAWAERNPGLTLDVEHLWKFTLRDAPLSRLVEEVRAFLARYGEKLRHVHMPGYWPGLTEHRPMYCAREMVFAVLSLLAEARFEGLVVSEVSTEYQNPEELRMDTLLFDVWREQHDPAGARPETVPA
jgi:sugar phosphate isomerase/epimerase